MENPAKNVKTLIESAEHYAITTFELSKLRAIKASIKITTHLITRISTTLVILMAVFMVNLALAFMIGDLLGKVYLGFFAIGGVYLIAGLVFHNFLYGWIEKSWSKFIISQLFNQP